MRSTDARRFGRQLAVLGLLVGLAAAAGAPVRATYGARTSADEPQYLITALSLADDGDVDIADELDAEQWRAFHEAALPEQTRPLPGGRRVSPHDPLLPMLLAVPVALGGWLAAKLTLAAFAGVLAALTGWVAVRRLGLAARTALPLLGVLFASAPLAVYGTQVYPEIPAALAVMAAVAALTGPLRRGGCWLLAVTVIALPWLAVKYAPVAAALAAVGLWRLWCEGRRRAAGSLTVVFAAAAVVFVGVHQVVWTGFTAYASGDHFVGGELTAVGSRPNYAGRSVRLLGLLVDREFGVAAWQPAWLLVVPAAAWAVRRRVAHWAALILPLAAGWLTATFVALTMHGYWFPGRQLVVVLPLAGLLVAQLAHRSAALRRAAAVAGALGVAAYGWLVVEGLRGEIRWIIDFTAVSDPWYRLWSQALPAYRTTPPGTWPRHAVWIVLTVVAAVGAWRRAGRYEVASSTSEPVAEPDADPDPEPDAEPEPPSSMVRTPAPSSPPQAVAPSASTRATPDRRSGSERDGIGVSFDGTGE